MHGRSKFKCIPQPPGPGPMAYRFSVVRGLVVYCLLRPSQVEYLVEALKDTKINHCYSNWPGIHASGGFSVREVKIVSR